MKSQRLAIHELLFSYKLLMTGLDQVYSCRAGDVQHTMGDTGFWSCGSS